MVRKTISKKEKRSLKQLTFYSKHGERTVLGKFFYDGEGNLKAVPVGITTVLALIFLISLVVQVKEPAKETVVKVTHLFQAQPPPTESQKAVGQQPLEKEKSVEQEKHEKEKTEEDKKVLETEKKSQTEDTIEAIKSKVEQTKNEAKQMKQEAVKTLAEAQKIKQETEELKASINKSQSKKNEKMETLEDELLKKEAALKEADAKNSAQRAQLEEAEEELQRVELQLKNTEEEQKRLEDNFKRVQIEVAKDKVSQEAQKKLHEVKEQAEDVQDKSETVRDEAVKYRKSADDMKEKSKGVGSQLTALANESKWLGKKEKVASLEISNEDYLRLYQSRITGGSKEPETIYRWRVSNRYGLKLKDCYTLFDMKAVAMTKDGRYYDLNDLSQLNEDYLNDNFSSTVILCEDPEVDFGNKIRALDLAAQDITVRYYMYGHTRNYFYNRVEMAVACCLKQGKIPQEKNWKTRIDVVGNVYQIKKEGGGFGVFVPSGVYYQGLTSDSLQEISVSPACFPNEEDVKILNARNLL